MTLNKAIKFNAKKCLRNNWGRAILIFVIMAAVSAVLGALDNAIFSAFGFHRVEISIRSAAGRLYGMVAGGGRRCDLV